MTTQANAEPGALVSTEWLAARLEAPDIRVVDASWKMPGVTPTAREDYEQHHIPGAVFFDIDDIAADGTGLPHMLPPPEKFAQRVRRLGLGDGVRIVVYDSHGLFSAARVWWTFRVFGHTDVAVLDGGLPKWQAEGRPVDDRWPTPRERHFTARIDTTLVRDQAQILANLETAREQVVDARAAGRFDGTAPEPWPARRRGHIPGSRNLPFDRLATEGPIRTVRPKAELRRLFAEAGIDLDRPIVASCGSGITAGVLAFCAHLLGKTDIALYDGSWAQWGLPEAGTPVETGPAAP